MQTPDPSARIAVRCKTGAGMARGRHRLPEATSGPKPVATRGNVALEARFEHVPQRGFHGPVAHRRKAQRTLFGRAGFGDPNAPGRWTAVALGSQFFPPPGPLGRGVFVALLHGLALGSGRAPVGTATAPAQPCAGRGRPDPSGRAPTNGLHPTRGSAGRHQGFPNPRPADSQAGLRRASPAPAPRPPFPNQMNQPCRSRRDCASWSCTLAR